MYALLQSWSLTFLEFDFPSIRARRAPDLQTRDTGSSRLRSSETVDTGTDAQTLCCEEAILAASSELCRAKSVFLC
jgi:hypothetical protein